jgi:rhamnulokinase
MCTAGRASDPHSYRSPRTEGWREVARSLGEAELYRRTGVQLMPINTIFQLAAHDRDELARARQLVMLPELVAYELTGEVASERSNAGTPVHLVAAHDTACAFAASPLDDAGHAVVSAGTWSWCENADTSEAARAANFSNEVGATGGYRFLKNVTGFWLLEQCARVWDTTTQALLDLAAEVPDAPVFDVRDERSLGSERMGEKSRGKNSAA